MKKIYFAGSIRGGRQDAVLYQNIVSYLQAFGTVLSEHIADNSLTTKGSAGSVESIHDQDIAWLTEADVIIAEVTTPSLGVGYEIATAAAQNKPILCLYREQEGKQLSAMIAGCQKTTCKTYQTLEQVQVIIKEFMQNLQG